MATLQVYNMSRSSFFWFRILPGSIVVALLTSPIWSSYLGLVDVILVYLAFVATYVLYKSIQTSVTNVIGYSRMQTALKRNWAKELSNLDLTQLPRQKDIPASLSELYHVIFMPIYREPFELLDKTFSALASQDYPSMKNVIIVAAVEERAGEEEKAVITRLQKKYASKFFGIWDFYHPFGIPGEVVGDACANLRWTAEKTTKRLAHEKIPSQNVIFTKFDSDTRLHKKHLSALTYTYLVHPKRMNAFFSPAILTYSNNFWKVPGLVRVFFGTLTLGVLNEWVAEKQRKQAFSCYSANYRILEKTDYWNASTGAEDTYFYWNAFLHLDGDFVGEPFYLPATMDAMEGHSLASTLISLYKQQLRWGWGVLIMPIALQGMSWNKKIGITKKISKFGILFRAYNFMLTAGVLLTVAMPLLTYINGELEYSSISYNLPRIISVMLASSIIFQIPAKYYTWKFYGAPPKEKPPFFKFWWWTFEPFLMFVNIWTYYFIPRVQALWELTFGKNRKKFLVAIESRLPANL